MKKIILILFVLFLTSCGNSPTSGYLCSCEQRQAVGVYVSQSQVNLQSIGGFNPDHYVESIYATAVRTICDHRDSVMVNGGIGIGLKPCEMFHPDYLSIRP